MLYSTGGRKKCDTWHLESTYTVNTHLFFRRQKKLNGSSCSSSFLLPYLLWLLDGMTKSPLDVARTVARSELAAVYCSLFIAGNTVDSIEGTNFLGLRWSFSSVARFRHAFFLSQYNIIPSPHLGDLANLRRRLLLRFDVIDNFAYGWHFKPASPSETSLMR